MGRVDDFTIHSNEVARAFDVPPWIIKGDSPRPRLWRIRWFLRYRWPRLVWPTPKAKPGESYHSPDLPLGPLG
jgi:hypothetical protein